MAKREKGSVKGVSLALLAAVALAGLLKVIFPLPLPQLITLEAATHVAAACAVPLLLLFSLSLTVPDGLGNVIKKRVRAGDPYGARRLFYLAWIVLTLVGLVAALILYFSAGTAAESMGVNVRSAQQMPMGQTGSAGTVINFSQSIASAAPFVGIAFSLLAVKGYFSALELHLLTDSAEVLGQLVKLFVGLLTAASWLKNGPVAAATGAILGYTIGEGVTLLALVAAHFFNAGHQRLFQHWERTAPKEERTPLGGELVAGLLEGMVNGVCLCVLPACVVADAFNVVKKLVALGFSQAQALDVYGLLAAVVMPLLLFVPVIFAGFYKRTVARTREYVRKKDLEGLQAFAFSQCKISFVLAMFVLLILLTLGDQVTGVLAAKILTAEDLALAGKMLKIGSVGSAAAVMGMGMTPVLIGMGRAVLPLCTSLFSILLKVLIQWWIMGNADVNVLGAVFSTAAALACFGVINTAFVLQFAEPPKNAALFLLMPLMAAVLSGALVNLILLGIWPTFFATFNGAVISLLVAILIYALICLATRSLSKEDFLRTLL